ncbi:MAG: hypothetical protein HC773_08400 [Scytonema sp. CRU_2_7]|nr:hypothetical protein [Scytonema sp. CRU_2_7]
MPAKPNTVQVGERSQRYNNLMEQTVERCGQLRDVDGDAKFACCRSS